MHDPLRCPDSDTRISPWQASGLLPARRCAVVLHFEHLFATTSTIDDDVYIAIGAVRHHIFDAMLHM